MELGARNNVPALTALLTVVSLALVFGAALRVIPVSLLPQASPATLALVPHVNAVVSTVAIGTIVAGVVSARRGEYRRHRALMVTSLALFATFLVLYLYKVILAGPAPFPGPETVYRLVYLPTLAVHVLLAVVCIPLLYYVALLAATRPISQVFGTRHKRVGRAAASLWLVSFVLGNAVYVMLYLVPW
jgi:putative membrane protein